VLNALDVVPSNTEFPRFKSLFPLSRNDAKQSLPQFVFNLPNPTGKP